MSKFATFGRARVIAMGCLVAALAGLSACSDGGSSSKGTGNKIVVSGEAPKSGCGSYDLKAPADPDGVVADIGGEYATGLRGYPSPVRKSAFSNWKPNHGPPYTVGIVWNQLTTPFQIASTEGIQKTLKSSPLVGDVLFSSTGAEADVGKEIQLMNSLLRKKPDIILLEPLTAPSFTKQLKQTAAADIPVLMVLDSYDSPHVVNVGGNNVLQAAQASSGMARLMGGKGRWLYVHAVPGSTPDVDSNTGLKAVLSNCPDLKKAGDVYGGYSPSQARSETLKYLGTNAAPVDGAFQVATMASGVMQAFEQAGREIPPVTDQGNTKGSLGYWINNKDSYSGIGTGLGGGAYGVALANIALRMLEGQGIKTNSVVQELPVIDEKTLDQWADPKWDLNTPGTSEGPPGAFGSDEFLDPLFNKPAPPKKK